VFIKAEIKTIVQYLNKIKKSLQIINKGIVFYTLKVIKSILKSHVTCFRAAELWPLPL
jgi:hypothetical protein